MCGRITQKSDPRVLGLGIATLVEPLYAAEPVPPRFNGAPGQPHWVIRQHPNTGERHLDRLWWGLVPYWIKEASPKRRPINATADRVASAPMFRNAYAKRRCIVPVDNFFEWAKAAKGARQPYVVAMKSGEPFALAAIWEGWRHPETDEVVRTFCIITTEANRLVADIHDRMPVILAPASFDRWLSRAEPDPRDLLVPYAEEAMTAWAISTRVNKPENDDPSILDRLA